MINRMALKLSKQMIDKNIVENEDKECYVYGLELLLSKMIVLSVIGIISIITNLVIPSVIFTFLYLLLRQYTGGFHCKTAERCIALSVIIYIVFAAIYKSNFTYSDIIMLIMSVISYITVWIFSPLADANKEIDDNEKIKYRKISIFIGSIMFVLAILSFIANMNSIFVSVSFSLISDAILLIIAIMKKRRNEICF